MLPTRSPARGKPRSRQLALKHFPFVGAGRSKQDKLSPVSERHDETLVEAFQPKKRR